MATRYWIGSSGKWTDPSDWSGAAVPAAGDDVVIEQPGTFSIAVTSAVAANSLLIDASGATLSENAQGKITTTGAFVVNEGTANLNGSNNFGLFGLTGGTVQFSSAAALGNAPMFLQDGIFRATASATLTGAFELDGNAGEAVEIDAKTGTTLSMGGSGWTYVQNGQHIDINSGATNTGTVVWNNGGNANVTGSVETTVVVGGGTLQAGDSALSPLLSSFTFVDNGAVIDLNGFDTSAFALEMNPGSTVTNTSATKASLTLGSQAGDGDSSVYGSISGNIAIFAAGDLVFETSQTYTGGTTIGVNGAVILGGNATTLSGPILDNGFLAFRPASGAGSLGTISGTGGVEIDSGILTLDHANSYTGGTYMGGTTELGQAKGFGTGFVSFSGGGDLIGTATEALANEVDFNGAINLEAVTGTTLSLTTGAINIALQSQIQIGEDAAHAGTVVIKAGGGFHVNPGTHFTVEVQSGTLRAGDSVALSGLLEAQAFTFNTGTTLDLNGQSITLGSNVSVQLDVSIVNSAASTASLQVANNTLFDAPTGHVAVSLVAAGLVVANDGYSGGTTLDSTSLVVIGPDGSSPLAVINAFSSDQDGFGTGQFAMLANGPSTFGSAIDDDGTVGVVVTQKAVLTGNITGTGKIDLFGTGPTMQVELSGNDSAFTGTVVADRVTVLLDHASEFGGTGGQAFEGYDAGLVAQQSVQLTKTLDLHGDSLLGAVTGETLKLSGAFDLSVTPRTGSNDYSYLTVSFGDTAHKGTVIFNATTENIDAPGGQPLFVDVEAGTLMAGNSTSLNNLVASAAAFTVAKGATVDLNGFALDLSVFSNQGIVTNTAAMTAALSFSGPNIVGGLISGNIAIDVLSSSQLTLIGNATNGPGVTIASGSALQIGNGGSAGSVTNAIADNGTVIFDHNADKTYAGVISGSGSVIVEGAGILTLSGNETFTGHTTLKDSATVAVTGSWSENIAFTGAETLKLAGTDSFSGTLTGFQHGGKIDLGNIAFAGATHAWHAATNTLTVTGNGHTDTLQFAAGLTANNFKFLGDGAGGIDVIYQTAPQAPDTFAFSSSNTGTQNDRDDAIHDAASHASAPDFADDGRLAFSVMARGDGQFPAYVIAHHGDFWG